MSIELLVTTELELVDSLSPSHLPFARAFYLRLRADRDE